MRIFTDHLTLHKTKKSIVNLDIWTKGNMIMRWDFIEMESFFNLAFFSKARPGIFFIKTFSFELKYLHKLI